MDLPVLVIYAIWSLPFDPCFRVAALCSLLYKFALRALLSAVDTCPLRSFTCTSFRIRGSVFVALCRLAAAHAPHAIRCLFCSANCWLLLLCLFLFYACMSIGLACLCGLPYRRTSFFCCLLICLPVYLAHWLVVCLLVTFLSDCFLDCFQNVCLSSC